MRRHIGSDALGAALLVIGLGCGAAEAAVAQEMGGMHSARTIRVSGTGETRMTPDEARLTFAVETFEPTAGAAGAENARRMERLVEALTAAGIPRTDIETQHYMVHPEYVHEEGVRDARLRGYRAMNQILVRTRELDRAGELIDVGLAAGANRVDGISFAVTDPAAGVAEALAEAVARARGSAEAIAGALGVRLGQVLDASTHAAPPRPMPYAQQRMDIEVMAATAAPTPIQPGEQTVTATVFLVFAIEGG